MSRFGYPQFCPIARAAEVLGHRWNLLILRELFLGPQRFSDLRRRLSGVSSSVLAERLRGLEAAGVVRAAELPAPAASSVYELTEDGRAFWPALRELGLWGLRFQRRRGRREDDHVEPDWVRLAAQLLAACGPTPARRFRIRVDAEGEEPPAVFRVWGGPDGTHVAPGASAEGGWEAEATLRGHPLSVLGVLAGAFAPGAPGAPADLSFEGDAAALSELPSLFDLPSAVPGAPPPPEVAPVAPTPRKGTP